MGQRVNIQYSVELDQLDVEVQRLIKGALTHIQQAVNECNQINQAAPLTIGNCDRIDDIRTKLSSADQSLSDISNIIHGYLNYKTSASLSAAEQTQTKEANAEGLSQKIKDFKESIEQASDEVSS